MKKIIFLLLAISIFIPAFAQDAPTARQIVDNAQKVTKLEGSESVNTLIIYDNKGNERVRKLAGVSKMYDGGATEKRLMKFKEPADVKGTAFLTYDYEIEDDDMWMYLPELRKVRRIVSSEKSKNFMSSEFTYADMTTFSLDDFTYKLLGEEEIDGVACYKVEIIPADEDIEDEYGFSKRISWFGKEYFVPRKSEYYDFDEELERVMTVLEVKEIDEANHKFKMTHMVMDNLLNGRKSEMIFETINLRTDIPDEVFTQRYLERE